MSVISSLKTKLSTAKSDFSKSLVLPFRSTRLDEKPVAETEAGFALLSLYQTYWSDIHRSSEANAGKAQEMDVTIADIAAKVGQQATNINQFLTEMTKLAEMQSQIDTARERIAGLGTSCSELEDKLVLLEDMCNEMQQNNNKFEHEYQLRKYRERKHLELEQIKATKAKQHASRVQRFEEQMCARLKERQKVFEAAFMEQMQNYRALGRIPDNPVVVATSVASTDLSDIAIDDDRSLLDEFLASQTLTSDEVHAAESLAMDNTIASAAEVTEHMTEEPDSNTADMTDRPDSLPTVTEDEAYVIVNKNE